jgi:RsiW-degrading membrane proteinase PrsW (M82 family)
MIDPKAVLSGQVRRGVPVGAIVSIAISSVCLAGFLGLFLLVGGLVFIVAAILSVITLVPMVSGVLALDRLEPEPMHLLVTTFLWGAGASVVLSLILSSIGAAVFQIGFGESNEAVESVLLAPVIEEPAKALVLFGLFWFRRSEFNGITDGVVYAAMSALGFAAAENIGYYIIAASEGASNLALIFVMRGILSPFCHPVFTAMTGIGLAVAVRQRNQAARFFLPLGGLLLAMVLHAIWNGSATYGIGALGIAFLIMIGVLVGILVAVRVDRKRTVGRIHACMTQYIPTGLVTGADLTMLSTLKARKQARDWARSKCGKNGFDAMRDYQQACTELTILHDRAIDGMVPAPQFEAHRNALLALMRLARDAFLGPGQPALPMMNPFVQAPPRQV